MDSVCGKNLSVNSNEIKNTKGKNDILPDTLPGGRKCISGDKRNRTLIQQAVV
jgi:hypothetical protein